MSFDEVLDLTAVIVKLYLVNDYTYEDTQRWLSGLAGHVLQVLPSEL